MKTNKHNILQMMNFNGLECMDIGDKEFDMTVTVDIPLSIMENQEPEDEYDKFMEKILTTIPVEELEFGIADFYGFLDEYLEDFRELSEWGEWNYIPEDDDDLIEMWINELQGLCAGAGNDTIYQYLNTHWPGEKIMQTDNDIEQKVYENLCVGCENESQCHEDCDTCEAYDRAVENLKEAQNA